MCGIHGVIELRGERSAPPEVLSRMGAATRHRGPDDEGQYRDGPLAFGMRRLSIIDLAGGHQPLFNEDESLALVCNGEIYNFRQLREALIARGHRFRTASDVEVILHLYEEHGDGFVSHLDGMFAFALWDRRRHRLLIGRDPIGIKPLYLLHDTNRLGFASEAKALLQLPGVRAEIDRDALGDYLALGYVPAPRSLFRGISKLPPATLLIVDRGVVTTSCYWRLPKDVDRSVPADDWRRSVRDRIGAAVEEQMVSDVPLGAFLSGGIDSSAVVGLMARASRRPVKTYSIGFEGSSGSALYNELPYARQVAKLFGTEHHEIVVRPDVVGLLPKLLWHMDEPMADAALVTTYLVSEFARKDVTVILSGVGGDELFGGYRRYQDEYYRQRYHRLPQWLRHGVISRLAALLPSDRHSRLLNVTRLARSFLLADALPFAERYERFVEILRAEQRSALLGHVPGDNAVRAALRAAQSSDPLHRLMSVDFATQLPDDLLLLTDKMSMATSLECRVPLLDLGLVEMAARIPADIKMKSGQLKSLLKESLRDLLPESILFREKRGFGAPMGAWIKSELAPLLGHVLSRASVESRGWLSWPAVEKTISEHRQNAADNTDALMCMLNLEIWARIYVDGRSSDDLSTELSERLVS